MTKLKLGDHYSLSREKFSTVNKIKSKLSYERFVSSISLMNDYLIWLEDTPEGKGVLEQLHGASDPFRAKLQKKYERRNAVANKLTKPNAYNLRIAFIERYGHVNVEFENSISRKEVEKVLDLAEHLDAMFLINGKKEIKRKDLDQYFS